MLSVEKNYPKTHCFFLSGLVREGKVNMSREEMDHSGTKDLKSTVVHEKGERRGSCKRQDTHQDR